MNSSPISHLKTFHNWIKKNDFTIYGGHNQIIVELASGAGGDLAKIAYATPNLYICLEKSIEHIQEAKSRYNSLTLKHRIPNIQWFQCDLSTPTTFKLLMEKQILPRENFADLFSMQFAFSYFCDKLSTCLNLLYWISYYLKPGAYFIGTTIDGNSIKKLLLHNSNSDNNNLEYKNSAGYIKKLENNSNTAINTQTSPYKRKKITSNDNNDENGKEKEKEKENNNNNTQNTIEAIQNEFGQVIHFTLANSILGTEGVTECLVPFETIVILAESVDLRLVNSCMFEELYKTYPQQDLTEDEKVFSFINRTFIFQKKNSI